MIYLRSFILFNRPSYCFRRSVVVVGEDFLINDGPQRGLLPLVQTCHGESRPFSPAIFSLNADT